MTTNAVPSLTSEGWITAVDKKCDRLLMNAFASDQAQSNAWLGRVTSIQYLIYQAGKDMRAAGDSIATALVLMFGRHFDAASFKATVTEYADGSGRYDIRIKGEVVQAMRRYDFGRVLESVNGMIAKFMTDKGAMIWTPNMLNQ